MAGIKRTGALGPGWALHCLTLFLTGLWEKAGGHLQRSHAVPSFISLGAQEGGARGWGGRKRVRTHSFYFVYLFTGLLISSLIHLLINSIAHSPVCSPVHFLAQSLITFLICPLTVSLIYSFTTQLSPGTRSAPSSRTGQEVPSSWAFCDFSLPDRPSCVACPPAPTSLIHNRRHLC